MLSGVAWHINNRQLLTIDLRSAQTRHLNGMLRRLQQASGLVKQWAIIDCRTAAGAFSSHAAEARESMQYDVCIVGAGPAGLSAAIKLKQVHSAPRLLACCQGHSQICSDQSLVLLQRCKEADKDLSVCVLEKGAEVGVASKRRQPP